MAEVEKQAEQPVAEAEAVAEPTAEDVDADDDQ